MLAVMLFQHGFVHTVQLLAGQDGEQAPAKVQALVDGAVLIGALAQKFLFEVGAEIQIQFIGLAKLLFADDAGQVPRVVYLGVAGEQLVGNGGQRCGLRRCRPSSGGTGWAEH